ncbi:MAG: class F sortase [Actinomycetota bacterium]|nr:class F sortase [Actinomycetota bacterium]
MIVTVIILAGCGAPERENAAGPLPPAPPTALAVPTALTDDGLNLRAGPVAVPLELQMPSLSVSASVVGVGITPKNVMDAPMGPAEDPVWQQAFWYRGSAVPGALSTALIAGHVGGPGGTSAVFAHLDRLRPGDPIVVHDTRSALDVRFSVTESKTYSLAQAADPAVLTQIYGAGPVAGTWPQPSADGLAHLTLITCTGTFRNGTHDHRLVVYATRTA